MAEEKLCCCGHPMHEDRERCGALRHFPPDEVSRCRCDGHDPSPDEEEEEEVVSEDAEPRKPIAIGKIEPKEHVLYYVGELLHCDYVVGNGVTAFDGSENCMRHLREHIDSLRIVFEELRKREFEELRKREQQEELLQEAMLVAREAERDAITSWLEPRGEDGEEGLEVDRPTALLIRAQINSIRRGDHRKPKS